MKLELNPTRIFRFLARIVSIVGPSLVVTGKLSLTGQLLCVRNWASPPYTQSCSTFSEFRLISTLEETIGWTSGRRGLELDQHLWTAKPILDPQSLNHGCATKSTVWEPNHQHSRCEEPARCQPECFSSVAGHHLD